MRLFCFPYSGGGAWIYREWDKYLPQDIDARAILLPGRETRLFEGPVSSLEVLLKHLVPAIKPYLDIPFAFFGHSMGALICWELARWLRKCYGLAPSRMFVSGSAALPYLHEKRKDTKSLSDSELVAELGGMNGTHEEILKDAELMALLLPGIRADFDLVYDYDYKPAETLECPVTALGGDLDPEVFPEDLVRWAELTTGETEVELLPGGHFYLHDCRAKLIDLIAARLGYACPARAAGSTRSAMTMSRLLSNAYGEPSIPP